MMTTCRLLCGLLVLALCCCPSVCVTGTGVVNDSPGLSPHQRNEGVGSGPGNISTTPSSKGDPGTLTERSEKAVAQGSPGPGPSQQEHPTTERQGPPTQREPGDAVTVGSDGHGGAMPETSGNSAAQPNGTPNLEEAPRSHETVQEEAEITGTVGSSSRSASSNEHKEVEEKQSEGSDPGHVPSEGPYTTIPESVTKEGPSGSANPMAQIGTNGTATVQSQEETVPNTTTTTAPETSSTT
ncbi:hypothetical protein MOQ_003979, partial [Trypanosoma cruzi marinkellei]